MTDQTFPATRLRRNRLNDATRRMVAEHRLSVDDLIWPVFIREGSGEPTEIASMPGVFRTGLDGLARHVEEGAKLRIPAIALFPVTPPELKDPTGSEALNPQNLICRAARILKREFPQIMLLGDVALDPYTDHGHDGVLVDDYVANDASVDILTRQALNQTEAGIDIVAPSDMMDGRIGAIRAALDGAGFVNTGIMSYAAKYASAFYGPFRDAIGSGGALRGDKKTYQMNPANSRRGAARGRHGHCRRCRYGDGQAGHAVSRHHPPREGTFRNAGLRLSGLGRVCDDRRGGAQWLAR